MQCHMPDGIPGVARMRAAVLLDSAAGLVIAVLLYPFPAMRALLPTSAFVVSIILSIGVVSILLSAVSVVLSGRTAGLYLFGLRVDPQPGPAAGRWWGTAWTATALLSTFSARAIDAERGFAARVSALRVTWS